MKIARKIFNSEEWREIALAPFWMTAAICRDSRAAPELQSLLTSELAAPQLYPPFTRTVYLTAALEPEAGRRTIMQSAQTARQKLETVRQILNAKIPPVETFKVQTHLAMLGRTLLKCHGRNLTGQTVVQRLAELWEILSLDSGGERLQKDEFTAAEWRSLQLLWLFARQSGAPPGARFSAGSGAESFPPLVRELAESATSESNALEKLLAPNAETSFDFKQAMNFVNQKFNRKTAVYLQSVLLMAARDSLERNQIDAVNSVIVTKFEFSENTVNRFFEFAAALEIPPSKSPPPTAIRTAISQPEIKEIKVSQPKIENIKVAPAIRGNFITAEKPAETNLPNQPVEPPPAAANAPNPDGAGDSGEFETAKSGSGQLPLALGSFADYRRTGHIIGEDLQNLIEVADELKLHKTGDLIREVLERVRENSFSVAVVGEFKRGKSTFINALLGKDILPSDILPCSATLNRVTYGIKPIVTIHFKNGTEESVPIEKLADYVTKLTEESEERASTIREAVVEYPIPYCQNNIEIIDTPGLNDEANMTDVTLAVLPQVDAAILVIMAQSPFSEYEREFLEEKLLTSDLGRVIFVVTAIDRLNRPEDSDRLVADIKRRIQKFVLKRAAEQFGERSPEYESYLRKIGTPRVFGLSAYQALRAKETGDAALLMKSRFGEFEAVLEKFLSVERASIFLQVPANRLQTATSDIFSVLTIRENALAMQNSEFQTAFEKSVREIEAMRTRKTEELKKIDVAAARVQLQVAPLLDQLDETLKAEAERAIDAAKITQDDLQSKAETELLCRRVGEEVARSLQTVGQQYGEKIQALIERAIAEEASRWKDFSASLSQIMNGIETRFTGGEVENSTSIAAGGLGAIACFTGLGGVYSGYRVAGWKGMATGGAAAVATNFGTLLVIGLVSSFAAAFAAPLLIVGIISSYFAGGWLTKAIFGEENIKRFREAFKKTTLEQIDKHLAERETRANILNQIKAAFTDLKGKAHREVESTLSDTQETLFEMRSKRERDETLSAAEQTRLVGAKSKVLEIKRRSEQLNKMLLALSNNGGAAGEVEDADNPDA